jgi:hypothetical protein
LIVCFVTFIYGMLVFKLPISSISFAYIRLVVFTGHDIIFQILLIRNNRELPNDESSEELDEELNENNIKELRADKGWSQ